MNRSTETLYGEIALFKGPEQTLHYLVPDSLSPQVEVGKRVIVPLGRRETTGLIVDVTAKPSAFDHGIKEMRPILGVLDASPVVTEHLLKLCSWVARYYFHPLGQVLQLVLVPSEKTPPRSSLRLTPAGLEALPRRPQSSIERFLLERGEVLLRELEKAFPLDREARKELEELERAGYLERLVRTDPLPHPGKTARILRLLASPEETVRRNQALGELIHVIEEAGGSLPLAEARARVKNFPYRLRRLRQLGLVAVEPDAEAPSMEPRSDGSEVEPPELTEEQRAVFEAVSPFLERPSFKTFVVFGVTGSGKSELYLRLVETALAAGKGSLVLVPEIALTLQMTSLFQARFGSKLAVFHSALKESERRGYWQDLLSGRRKVLLGVRSAVFMPVSDLGVIIVDEEHDSSYKQDDRLRYHARDVAVMRAKMLSIPIVLGSATPSLQSLHHCNTGRYALLSMNKRIHDRPQPQVEVVDMRRESRSNRVLSAALRKALGSTYESGQQALLFLNRRGFAAVHLCSVCGQAIQCRNCSVTLTYHQHNNLLRCHYCGAQKPPPARCPVCLNPSLTHFGFGTERVEKEVRELLPAARTVRIDRDTIAAPHHLTDSLQTVRENRADVLIGTQMLTKGHDFPNLTLVGVVNADTALQISDFRSGETTVQLLMQVAGRAGRGEKPGRVILQTYNPLHYTIESVIKNDYETFAGTELESRKALQYPPFVKLARFLVTSHREAAAEKAAWELAVLCRELAAQHREAHLDVAVLGPSPAPLTKLKNRYRWQIYVKAWSAGELQEFIAAVMERRKNLPDLRRVHLVVDRDPMTGL